MKQVLRWLCCLSCVWLLVACGLSAEGIKAEAAKAAACTSDTDCVVLVGKCPIGCYVSVNKSEESRIKALLDGFSENCAYDCLASSGAVCRDGACQALTKE